MNKVKHEPFKKNFNETGETPNEESLINPNNASNEIYKNIIVQK